MKKIIIFAALCLSFQTACDKEDLGGSNIHVPEFDYNALSETDKYGAIQCRGRVSLEPRRRVVR